MPLSLHTIKPARGSKKKKKRVGRGGKRGTYSGRGIKGQKARSGTSGFKRRGMRPLMEQTPKLRGFKSRRPKPEIINLEQLNKYFSTQLTEASHRGIIKINPKILLKKELIANIKNGVKILGKGEIKMKLEISGCKVSKSVKEKIEKNGGKIS